MTCGIEEAFSKFQVCGLLDIIGYDTSLKFCKSFSCDFWDCSIFCDPDYESSIDMYEKYMGEITKKIMESNFFGNSQFNPQMISWVIVGEENWDVMFKSEFDDKTAADRFSWAQICIRGKDQNLIVVKGGIFKERVFPSVTPYRSPVIQSSENIYPNLNSNCTLYAHEEAQDLDRLRPDVVRELLHEFAHLFQSRNEPTAVMMNNPALTEGEVETFARINMNTQHDLPESTRFLAQIDPAKYTWEVLNDPTNGIEFPAEPVGTNEIYGMWFLGYLGLAYNLGLVNYLSDYNLSDDMKESWNIIHSSLAKLDLGNPESLQRFNRAIMADIQGHDNRINFIREYIVDQGLMRLREIMKSANGHVDLDRSFTKGCIKMGQKVLAFLYPFHLVDPQGNFLLENLSPALGGSEELEYYI